MCFCWHCTSRSDLVSGVGAWFLCDCTKYVSKINVQSSSRVVVSSPSSINFCLKRPRDPIPRRDPRRLKNISYPFLNLQINCRTSISLEEHTWSASNDALPLLIGRPLAIWHSLVPTIMTTTCISTHTTSDQQTKLLFDLVDFDCICHELFQIVPFLATLSFRVGCVCEWGLYLCLLKIIDFNFATQHRERSNWKNKKWWRNPNTRMKNQIRSKTRHDLISE